MRILILLFFLALLPVFPSMAGMVLLPYGTRTYRFCFMCSIGCSTAAGVLGLFISFLSMMRGA